MDSVSGLSQKELARVRGRLVEFAGEMFASMRRRDQRAWGECYLRGLMLKYWLSNLPEDTPIEDLVRLGKMRWRIEHDYRELKDALGLDHYEGRGYRGFNHHVTLVSGAHAFLTLERSRRDRRPRLRAAA